MIDFIINHSSNARRKCVFAVALVTIPALMLIVKAVNR